MTDTVKHFKQQTSSSLCSVLYLVHPKIKFHISRLWTTKIWHVCCLEDEEEEEEEKKKNTLKKTHLGQVFQSVTSFET